MNYNFSIKEHNKNGVNKITVRMEESGHELDINKADDNFNKKAIDICKQRLISEYLKSN